MAFLFTIIAVVSSTCYSGSSFGSVFLALLLRRLVKESQQRCRIDVASVVAALEWKDVLPVVLLERETGATRRSNVQGTAHVAPFLVLRYLSTNHQYEGLYSNTIRNNVKMFAQKLATGQKQTENK